MSLVDMEKVHSFLDIGCGGGGFIKYVTQKERRIKAYGLDHSDISVKVATDLNRRCIPERCVIMKGDVLNIPVDTGSVDLITAISSVYYWTEMKDAFSEIFRVLKILNEALYVMCKKEELYAQK